MTLGDTIFNQFFSRRLAYEKFVENDVTCCHLSPPPAEGARRQQREEELMKTAKRQRPWDGSRHDPEFRLLLLAIVYALR